MKPREGLQALAECLAEAGVSARRKPHPSDHR
jgi:hypothetical protein